MANTNPTSSDYGSPYGSDYYAPNEATVHAANGQKGFFIRWQFESGDSMMADKSLAEVCNLQLDKYRTKLIEYGGCIVSGDVYFMKEKDCQRAIDEMVQPFVLARIMSRRK